MHQAQRSRPTASAPALHLRPAADASSCSDLSDDDVESGGGGLCGAIGGRVATREEPGNEVESPPSQARGKNGKLKKLKSKYRQQEEGERQVILQVCQPPAHLIALHVKLVLQQLGSSGGAGHRKQLRALAKDAEKKARAAAAAAKAARLSQPEPLSPEFEFVVRLRKHCAAVLSLDPRSRAAPACTESRQRSDIALTIGQLRRMGSSGMLLYVLVQLSGDSSCLRSASANMCGMMLARVCSGKATPEVCCAPSAECNGSLLSLFD
jgi:hypothetical protein